MRSVAFSKNGKFIASGSNDKLVKLWNPETGKVERTFLGHKSVVSSVDFSPDGFYIVSCSYDNRIIIWNTKTGLEEKVLIGHNE